MKIMRYTFALALLCSTMVGLQAGIVKITNGQQLIHVSINNTTNGDLLYLMLSSSLNIKKPEAIRDYNFVCTLENGSTVEITSADQIVPSTTKTIAAILKTETVAQRSPVVSTKRLQVMGGVATPFARLVQQQPELFIPNAQVEENDHIDTNNEQQQPEVTIAQNDTNLVVDIDTQLPSSEQPTEATVTNNENDHIDTNNEQQQPEVTIAHNDTVLVVDHQLSSEQTTEATEINNENDHIDTNNEQPTEATETNTQATPRRAITTTTDDAMLAKQLASTPANTASVDSNANTTGNSTSLTLGNRLGSFASSFIPSPSYVLERAAYIVVGGVVGAELWHRIVQSSLK